MMGVLSLGSWKKFGIGVGDGDNVNFDSNVLSISSSMVVEGGSLC